MPDARARRGGRLEVVVGHESELFQDQDQAQLGDAHLALSLILLPPSLPEAPDPSVAREVKPEERASLDSFALLRPAPSTRPLAEHTVHVEVVFPATALESATFKLTQVSSC